MPLGDPTAAPASNEYVAIGSPDGGFPLQALQSLSPDETALTKYLVGAVPIPSSDVKAYFPLKSSLLASVFQGSDNQITFTRNNAGTNGLTTVRDYLGNLNYCRTDEAAFCGARRVENLFQDSSLMTTGWTLEGSTTRGATVLGYGRRFDRATASTTMISYGSLALEPGTHTVSFDAWVETGTVTIRIRIERADTTLVATQDIALSTTVKRIGLSGLVPDVAQTTRVIIGIPSGGPVHFCMGNAQFEYKADGEIHPSEYVARGVAGATYPFAGAGVDGVKYFETLNPNFLEVNATVRPDNTPGGVAIAQSVLKGIQRSPFAILRFLHSSAFDNAAWTKTGVTATQVAALRNPVGYGRAYRLDETAVTSVMQISQAWNGTIAADNLNLAVSFFVKKGSGRSLVLIGITNKANVTDTIWFNTDTGEVVWITSNTGTVTRDEVVVETYPNGWFRVGFGGMSAGSGGTTPVGFMGLADLPGNSSYLGVVGNYVYVAAGQLEQNDHPTAYIGNAAGTILQRSCETVINAPISSNVPTNNFTVGIAFTPNYKTTSKRKSDFFYIAYSTFDSNNRWGTALRPGIFGGNATDNTAAGWAQDFYPNSPNFGGVNITLGLAPSPFTTVSQLFGQASVPLQPNGDGSFMSVNGILAYSTTTATPTTLPIVNKASFIRIGGALGASKHDACYKNFVIAHRALSPAELKNPNSYA